MMNENKKIERKEERLGFVLGLLIIIFALGIVVSGIFLLK